MLKFHTTNLLTMGRGEVKQTKKHLFFFLFFFFKPDMVNKATPVIAAFCKLNQRIMGAGLPRPHSKSLLPKTKT